MCFYSLRTSEDPRLDDVMISFDQLRQFYLSCPNLTAEQIMLVNDIFTSSCPYSPDRDVESFKDFSRDSNVGRRSLFPANPKKILQTGSESSSNTILAHRRSMISLLGRGDSLTLPIPQSSDFTRHIATSSVSLSSSTQVSRQPSFIHQFKTRNASLESLSVASSDGSDVSVLDADFSNLTQRNKEKRRELKERSTSVLHK